VITVQLIIINISLFAKINHGSKMVVLKSEGEEVRSIFRHEKKAKIFIYK